MCLDTLAWLSLSLNGLLSVWCVSEELGLGLGVGQSSDTLAEQLLTPR